MTSLLSSCSAAFPGGDLGSLMVWSPLAPDSEGAESWRRRVGKAPASGRKTSGRPCLGFPRAAWARGPPGPGGCPFRLPSPLQALAAWACATSAIRDAGQAQQARHDAATQQADPNQEDSDQDGGS